MKIHQYNFDYSCILTYFLAQFPTQWYPIFVEKQNPTPIYSIFMLFTQKFYPSHPLMKWQTCAFTLPHISIPKDSENNPKRPAHM